MPRREQHVASFGSSGEPLIATMSVPEGSSDGRLLGLGDARAARDKSSSPECATARRRTRARHRARLVLVGVVVAALFTLALLLLLTLSAGRSALFRAFREPEERTGGARATTTDPPIPAAAALTPSFGALSSAPAAHVRALDLLVGAQSLPPFLRQPPLPLRVRRGRVAFLEAAAHSPLISDASQSFAIHECRVVVGERAADPSGQRGGTLFPKVHCSALLLPLTSSICEVQYVSTLLLCVCCTQY